MTALRLGLLYFIAVFALGFALGVLRGLVVEPALGELAAVAVELPAILAAAWFVCGLLLRRRRLTFREALVTGVSAFALMMLAETAVSALLFGRTPGEHLALYAEPAHLLGLAGQLAFAAFPLLRRRPTTGEQRG